MFRNWFKRPLSTGQAGFRRIHHLRLLVGWKFAITWPIDWWIPRATSAPSIRTRRIARVDCNRRIEHIATHLNSSLQDTLSVLHIIKFRWRIVFHPRKAMLRPSVCTAQDVISVLGQVVVGIVSIWVSPWGIKEVVRLLKCSSLIMPMQALPVEELLSNLVTLASN